MIRGLNHLTFAVSNLGVSFDFYTRALGLSPVARWEGGAYLLTGEDWITLIADPAVQDNPHPDYTHAAFTVGPEDFDEASRRVLGAGARLWQRNGTEGTSLYFTDPDGHRLELHASDLAARLAAEREDPPLGMEFYRGSADSAEGPEFEA
ncbi:VOC family protein [Rubrobacter aplysinae]|uniref:VOC family protein n=1 Tax=Rubrobacter aplysinae TaxID=909625 RepID=UPI00064BB735|nr:VOC family protein [Rubrobacter aplysinae]